MHVTILVHSVTNLAHVISALSAPSGGTCRLHSRQQERHQYANDGNHDQQLHQREGRPVIESASSFAKFGQPNPWPTTRDHVQILLESNSLRRLGAKATVLVGPLLPSVLKPAKLFCALPNFPAQQRVRMRSVKHCWFHADDSSSGYWLR
jgi:hypothetical protein